MPGFRVMHPAAPIALTLFVTFTAAAAPPREWPEPWAEGGLEDTHDGEPLASDAPLFGVCAAHARALGEAAPEVWVCRKAPKPADTKSTAVLRFTSESLGSMDHWLLALRDGTEWRLGGVVAIGDYSGVGGTSAAATVDTVVSAGDVVVVQSREFAEDTDMGSNAQMVWRRALLTVCFQLRCASAVIWHEESLFPVTDEEPPPPPEYGPVGTRLWKRPVSWDGKHLVVGTETGKRPTGITVRSLGKRASPRAFVRVYRPGSADSPLEAPPSGPSSP